MSSARSTAPFAPLLFVLGSVVAQGGCSTSTAAPVNVAAAPPPKDDGTSSKGGSGGEVHSAALEQLKVADLGPRGDKQRSVRLLLPDSERWTRVKFWGVPSLVGFRYGKDHHAIAGAFITHVPDDALPGACAKSFEDWAMPFARSFDVEIQHDAPQSFVWKDAVANIETLFAKTATLAERESYAVAYGAYPAWKGACLVVGIAVPSRDDEARARAVRDRFAAEVLPHVEVLSTTEPKERY